MCIRFAYTTVYRLCFNPYFRIFLRHQPATCNLSSCILLFFFRPVNHFWLYTSVYRMYISMYTAPVDYSNICLSIHTPQNFFPFSFGWDEAKKIVSMQGWSPKDSNVVTWGQIKRDNELAPKHNKIMTLFLKKKMRQLKDYYMAKNLIKLEYCRHISSKILKSKLCQW